MKYDEKGFATKPDFTCDFCGAPNEGIDYKETDNGEFACAECYEEWKKEQDEKEEKYNKFHGFND